MDWKNFFKPTLWKIGLVVLFIILLFFIALNTQGCFGGPCFEGIPLKYYKPAGCSSGLNGPCYDMEINFLNLTINIVILYLISCVIFIKNSLK